MEEEKTMAEYAHPETLVSTDWVAQHANDKNVRVAEVDVDTKAYDEGHVPGAIGWAWNTQLCDTLRRDILSRQQFEELMAASGVTPDTTLVIYGDNNNWFAAWALWQAKIYGHKDVRLMNGGRKKWLAEGRELSTEAPKPPRTKYTAKDADNSLRAFLPQVQAASAARSAGNHESRGIPGAQAGNRRLAGEPFQLPPRRGVALQGRQCISGRGFVPDHRRYAPGGRGEGAEACPRVAEPHAAADGVKRM